MLRKFYTVIDLDPTQPTLSAEELASRLEERNSAHRTTIRRFVKRYENAVRRKKDSLSLPPNSTCQLSHDPLKGRKRTIIRKSLCYILPSQKENRPSMQLSKIQVECQHRPVPPLHRSELRTLTEPVKHSPPAHSRQNVSVGVVNLCIDECEKQARMSKVYFDVLRRFNRCHVGRKIPIREWRERPNVLEKEQTLETQRCFWSDEKLSTLSSSHHILPKLPRLL